MTASHPALPAVAQRRSQLALAAILLVSFALRLYRLAAPSLNLAEMAQASLALRGLAAVITDGPAGRGAGPLDTVLAWAALQLAAVDMAVRLPAVFIGTLTIALLYRLGRTLFDQQTGALAALLLALAPLHLGASRTAGYYALLAGLAVGSTLAMIVALRRNRRRDWAAYAFLLVAALYCHSAAATLAATQGLVVLLYPPRLAGGYQPGGPRRRFLLSLAAAVVAWLPWVLLTALRPAHPLTSGSATLPPGQASAWWVGWIAGEAPTDLPTALLWLYWTLALVGVVAGLAQPRLRLATLLVGAPLLSAALVMGWAQQRMGVGVAAQQLVYVLPFFLLLVSLGVVTLVRLIGNAWLHRETPGARLAQATAAIVLVGALLVPLRPAAGQVFSATRPDWRHALAFIAANAGAEDAVLTPGLPLAASTYYLPGFGQRLRDPRSLSEVLAAGEAAPAVWVVAGPGINDTTPGLHSALRAAGALLLDFGADLAVYYWQPGQSLTDTLQTSLRWTPPRNLTALESLAYAYADAAMPEAAASAARQAVALADTRQTASRYEELRGSIWRRFGDKERAIAAYQQALSLWPDNHEALVRLGEQLLARKRADEAAVYLERAVQVDPASYWAQRLLGEARVQQGRFDEALPLWRATVAARPDEPTPYIRLGDVLVATGDYADAIAAYERYLTLAPDGPKADEIRQRLVELRKAAGE